MTDNTDFDPAYTEASTTPTFDEIVRGMYLPEGDDPLTEDDPSWYVTD